MGKLTFFFDRNFGRRLPKALHTLQPPVEIWWHDRHPFPPNKPDDEWLQVAGEKGWIVFSHDRKFHSEATETAAVLQHNVACFYLPCASDPVWVKLRLFLRVFDRVVRIAESEKPPYVYDVKRNCHIVPVKLPE